MIATCKERLLCATLLSGIALYLNTQLASKAKGLQNLPLQICHCLEGLILERVIGIIEFLHVVEGDLLVVGEGYVGVVYVVTLTIVELSVGIDIAGIPLWIGEFTLGEIGVAVGLIGK